MASVRELRGVPVEVYDSLGDFLLVRECLTDDELTAQERGELLLQMVLADPSAFFEEFGEDGVEAFQELVWDSFGIDLKGDKPHEKPVMDWDEDHDRIVATVRAAYHMSFDELRDVQYREAAVLIGMAPDDTPMGRALYYRLADPPKRTKSNKEEVKAFNKAREFYKLGKKGAVSTEAANQAATSEFEALKRMAGHGKQQQRNNPR